jgi:L-ribulose-5-phosphate 3-epimerase
MIADGNSVLEKFQILKGLGFDGVELDSPNGLDRQEILDAREATGLPIHGVVDSAHWGKPFSHPEKKVRKAGLQALETALRDCQAYGGSTVLVVPAVVNKQVSYTQAWDRSIVEISRLVPLAEELQIKIAFENVWNNFLLSPLEMARYIDTYQSAWVGSYLDVGNLVRYAWPEHWVEALQERICKVDVKGYSRKKQNDEGLWKGFQVKIGEGDEDWPTVNRALYAVGYRGWFTAEVSGGGKQRLAEIADAMDRIMAIPPAAEGD